MNEELDKAINRLRPSSSKILGLKKTINIQDLEKELKIL